MREIRTVVVEPRAAGGGRKGATSSTVPVIERGRKVPDQADVHIYRNGAG
jgi:hypothetical protein